MTFFKVSRRLFHQLCVVFHDALSSHGILLLAFIQALRHLTDVIDHQGNMLVPDSQEKVGSRVRADQTVQQGFQREHLSHQAYTMTFEKIQAVMMTA
jgi:hypothetical protein